MYSYEILYIMHYSHSHKKYYSVLPATLKYFEHGQIFYSSVTEPSVTLKVKAST